MSNLSPWIFSIISYRASLSSAGLLDVGTGAHCGDDSDDDEQIEYDEYVEWSAEVSWDLLSFRLVSGVFASISGVWLLLLLLLLFFCCCCFFFLILIFLMVFFSMPTLLSPVEVALFVSMLVVLMLLNETSCLEWLISFLTIWFDDWLVVSLSRVDVVELAALLRSLWLWLLLFVLSSNSQPSLFVTFNSCSKSSLF